MSDRVVIIGGGVMGLGVAWQLAGRGYSVTLVERGEPGRGASWAAAGMLAPWAEIEFHEHDLLRFAAASQSRWPSFARELATAADIDVEYDDTGTLVVAVDRDDAESLQRLFRYQREEGLDVTWLSAAEARRIEPMLSPKISGAVHAPGDHQVSNRQVIAALGKAAARAGVELRTHVEVTEVVIEGGSVRAVGTRDGERLDTDLVVVAAGAWSRQIAGLEQRTPPVRPVKGQMLALRMDRESPLVRHVVRAPHAYLVPKADGTLVVGATSEEMGFDGDLTAGGVYELLDGAWEALPGILELPVVDMWTGFRPGCRDNGPILGGSDVSGLFFCTGHYRNGIQQLPASVDATVAAVEDGALPEVARPFSIERFATLG